jgi:hypothetical protein
MPKNKQKTAKKPIIVTSLKEFKKKYLPKEEKENLYNIDDPKRLGFEIAERIYEKNKHVLFSNK